MIYPGCLILAQIGVALLTLIDNVQGQLDINSGSPKPVIDPAPVAISFEFFMFPDYMRTLKATDVCLQNLADVSGHPTAVRIGGTTQDRALYDPTSPNATTYSVDAPGGAPASLTYGPSYIELAAVIKGPVTLGLNRQLAELNNSIAAAQQAIDTMGNLYAIELGNEPDLYPASSPITGGLGWNPGADAVSQVTWQAAIGTAINRTEIIQAGVFLQPPKWSVRELAPKEGSSLPFVKSFCEHAYPQSACRGSTTNLSTLMQHSRIVDFTAQFKPDVVAAHDLNKNFFLGETNSATCGGGGVSPTFGAALWIVDYVLQAVLNGVEKLYFHQGTIKNCPYCWWGPTNSTAPYYGAYFAAEALSSTSKIAMLDSGSDDFAAYALYQGPDVTKVLLYNSEYYASGPRPSHQFQLSGISGPGNPITAKRLTAPNAYSTVDIGQPPNISGLQFQNGTCAIVGEQQPEKFMRPKNGYLNVTVSASEAVLIFL